MALPLSMRAAVLVAPERFEVRTVPLPEVGPDEVLIKVQRCGLCGTDIHIFKGHYSADRLPLIPGHEFSGHVVAVGERATGVKRARPSPPTSTSVAGAASIAARTRFSTAHRWSRSGSTSTAGLPSTSRSRRATWCIPARTSIELGSADRAGVLYRPRDQEIDLRLGESVLILGAGPIGNLHLQLARQAGAVPIIVSEPNPGRAEWARRSGADHVVTDAKALRQVVLDATEGRGADVVIEAVGLASLYEQPSSWPDRGAGSWLLAWPSRTPRRTTFRSGWFSRSSGYRAAWPGWVTTCAKR